MGSFVREEVSAHVQISGVVKDEHDLPQNVGQPNV